MPSDLDVHLVVDNCSTRKHDKVKLRLATRPRCHLHFTPTCSSWLDQVDIITRKAVRRSSFSSVAQLKEKILRFTNHYNPGAQPFMWTVTADSILSKIRKLCTAISGTRR